MHFAGWLKTSGPIGLPTLAQIEAEQARRTAERERGSAAKAATESLSSFVRQGWHVVEPEEHLIWNWHIDLVCDHLQAISRGELRDLLINIPPGSAKSLLCCVFWPAWMWTHRPNWQAIFASYDRELAIRDSLRCRDLITSAWYNETFRPGWQLKSDLNVKSWFANTAGGWRVSTSVGGKGTGLRADCMAVDDPSNIKLRPTDDEFAHVRHWWFVRMSNRLRDQRRGARVCIGQRIDERDLSSHIITHGGYTHVCLPTEFDPTHATSTKWGHDPRTTRGDLMFPQRFGDKENDEAKNELGPEAYAAQHDQRPAPMVGNIFKAHWFRFWYPADVEVPRKYMSPMEDGTMHLHDQVVLPDNLDEVQSWDMTFKERSRVAKGKIDFVVGQVWGLVEKRRYLLYQVRERMGFTTTVVAVRSVSALYPRADLKLVEDTANGPAIMSALQEEIGGFEPVTPSGGKEARAHAASHTARAGYVYLPHPDILPWVKAFLHEVCTFPNAANDDQVDAMTQLINSSKKQATYGYQSAAKRLSLGGDATQQRGAMRADGTDAIISRRRGIL